jgi:hypothetical protein
MNAIEAKEIAENSRKAERELERAKEKAEKEKKAVEKERWIKEDLQKEVDEIYKDIQVKIKVEAKNKGREIIYQHRLNDNEGWDDYKNEMPRPLLVEKLKEDGFGVSVSSWGSYYDDNHDIERCGDNSRFAAYKLTINW